MFSALGELLALEHFGINPTSVMMSCVLKLSGLSKQAAAKGFHFSNSEATSGEATLVRDAENAVRRAGRTVAALFLSTCVKVSGSRGKRWEQGILSQC